LYQATVSELENRITLYLYLYFVSFAKTEWHCLQAATLGESSSGEPQAASHSGNYGNAETSAAVSQTDATRNTSTA